jgi:hypothetical protein
MLMAKVIVDGEGFVQENAVRFQGVEYDRE